MKSRYVSPSAAATTSAGGGGSIPFSSAPIGIDEITCEHSYRVGRPLVSAVTATARPPSRCTPVTSASKTIFVPASLTMSAAFSHIWPGPYFG